MFRPTIGRTAPPAGFRRASFAAGLSAALMILLSGAAPAPAQTAAAPAAALSVDPAAAARPAGDRSGARLAQNTCFQCHGLGVAPDLRRQVLDYATFHRVARHGLNAMPAFRETEISDAELRAVYDYIASRRVAPGEKPPLPPGTVYAREAEE